MKRKACFSNRKAGQWRVRNRVQTKSCREGRKMAKWTMAEVLRLALRHEMDNFGEYNKASQETENPAIRAMFEFLADEERNHIKLIRDKKAEFKVKE
jgi:rubrerythrin